MERRRSRSFDPQHLARFLKRFGFSNTVRAIGTEVKGSGDFVIVNGRTTFRSNRDDFAFQHLVVSWPKIEKLVERIPATEPVLVLDVGANLGLFSALVEKRCRAAEIHAFEPSPAACGYLRQNVTKNVVVNEVCVGDSDGEITFYDVSNSLQLGTALPEEAKRWHAQPRQVACVRLDTYLQRVGERSRFSVLKIDVQGFEDAVVRGLGSELARFDLVFVEASWMAKASIEAALQLCDAACRWEPVNEVYWGADLCCYMTPRAAELAR